MIPLIFLDTETTGLQPDRHTIWEIGWITAVHDADARRLTLNKGYQATVPLGYSALVKADPDALKVGHYEQRKTDGLREREAVIADLTAAIAQVMAQAGTDKVPHFVGAVPGFDHAMLAQNWVGWPGFGEGLWHYHLIDVETLAAGKLGVPPPYTSSALSEQMGATIDKKARHTALGDARWAVDLYAKVYELEVEEHETL